jgi:hypothetical protein
LDEVRFLYVALTNFAIIQGAGRSECSAIIKAPARHRFG